MAPKLKEAKYINAYTIWLRFEDGLEGEVDLESELWGKSSSQSKTRQGYRLTYTTILLFSPYYTKEYSDVESLRETK